MNKLNNFKEWLRENYGYTVELVPDPTDWYIEDSTCIESFAEVIYSKVLEIEQQGDTISNLRAHYFAMRDMVSESTGYTKVEMHDIAKKKIFPQIIENPDNFIEGGKEQPELSVTWLSEKGWLTYIEQFKLFASEFFNIYL